MGLMKTLRNCLLGLYVLFLPMAVQATSISQLSMDEMLARAELIFQGRVLSVEGRKGNKGRMYYTYVTFELEDVIKGEYSAQTLTLRFMGGAAGGRGLKVAGVVYPQLGEKGVYFVAAVDGKRANPLLGWSQGHFVVREDGQGAARVYTNQRQGVSGLNLQVPQSVRRINAPAAQGVMVDSAQAMSHREASSSQGGESTQKDESSPSAMGLEDFKRQLREAAAP